MKSLLKYLKTYYHEELNWQYLALVLLFMSIYTGAEYYFGISSYMSQQYYPSIKYIVFQFCLFFIPFLMAFCFYSIFYKEVFFWHKPYFWFILIIAPFLFCLRNLYGFWSDEINKSIGDNRFHLLTYKCIINILRDLIVYIPILLIWFVMDRKSMPLYGFSIKNINLKPYFIMLLLMLPLIVIASTQGDFISSYPKGINLWPLDFANKADRPYFLIYELVYGFGFIFIEFFFRGFLLMTLFKRIGWSCLIPVSCFYMTIHFGKPLGETISSFFGGTILGIIAIRTGSIAGGIIVHVGIAWLMEIGALIGRYYSQ